MAEDRTKLTQDTTESPAPEYVDDAGTIKLDENTTINTERTGPAPEPEIDPAVIEQSMSERDVQLRNRPGMRSPAEVEAMQASGELPSGAPREGMNTIEPNRAAALPAHTTPNSPTTGEAAPSTKTPNLG